MRACTTERMRTCGQRLCQRGLRDGERDAWAEGGRVELTPGSCGERHAEEALLACDRHGCAATALRATDDQMDAVAAGG